MTLLGQVKQCGMEELGSRQSVGQTTWRPYIMRLRYWPMRHDDKRCYSSKLYNIQELLEKCDRKLFNKFSNYCSQSLYLMLPQAQASSFRLRWSISHFPKINTKRFKSSFCNRLSFKYSLALWEILTVSALTIKKIKLLIFLKFHVAFDIYCIVSNQ